MKTMKIKYLKCFEIKFLLTRKFKNTKTNYETEKK